jgi:hypothetical protein
MPPPTITPQREDPTDAIARQEGRDLSARGSRTTPARAKALLMRLGTTGEPRDDDWLDASDEP